MSTTLTTAYAKVREFHRVMGQPCPDKVTPLELPRMLDARWEWISQEMMELWDATNHEQKPETFVAQLDALADILYLTLGTFVEMGIDPSEIFDAVHEANIRKLGSDGKPVLKPDGKISKPPGWVGPEAEIEKILSRS